MGILCKMFECKKIEVSSVANHILNNALHVYFLSNESNTLAQLTEVECLYDFVILSSFIR